MVAAQVAVNHGWGLNWYLRLRIYASVPTWSHSQMSLKMEHGTSFKWLTRRSLNQPKNSYKLCNDEAGHPILSLTESQWKLRQQDDQNFPFQGKPL